MERKVAAEDQLKRLDISASQDLDQIRIGQGATLRLSASNQQNARP